MWYVYILECSDKTYYTGITNNINKRLNSHSLKRGAKYTASRLPVKLIWSSEFSDRSIASKVECSIKKMKRSEKVTLINSKEPSELYSLKEYLKNNHYEKYMFGLGFIQVKVNSKLRYHFYHPELLSVVPDEEIHNHRYNFTSTVLKGTLSQTVFSVQPATEHDCDYFRNTVSCDPTKPAPNKSYPANIVSSFTSNTSAGGSYEINSETFHKVLPTKEPTITKVVRDTSSMKLFAETIRPKDVKPVCPFSPNMPEEEIYFWIERIIKE